MKGARLGVLAREADASDAVPLERKRVVQRGIDEMYFAAELRPGAVIYTGAGAADGMNALAPVMILPVAISSQATANFGARKLWPKTRTRITAIYTSPVGSANLFSLVFAVVFFGPGGTTTGPNFSVAWTAPGPAVANAILQTTAVITAGTHLVTPFGVTRVQLRRAGPDANANDLHILWAGVSFEEVA